MNASPVQSEKGSHRPYVSTIRIILITVAAVALIAVFIAINMENELNDYEDNVAGLSCFGSFTAQTLDGNTVTQDILRGHRLILINTWATWCGPCTAEIPHLEEVSHEYDPADLLIIGLCADTADRSGNPDAGTVETARELVSSLGATYLNLIPSGDIYSRYTSRVSVFPTTLVLDENGKVLTYTEGARSSDGWKQLIDSELEKLSE